MALTAYALPSLSICWRSGHVGIYSSSTKLFGNTQRPKGRHRGLSLCALSVLSSPSLRVSLSSPPLSLIAADTSRALARSTRRSQKTTVSSIVPRHCTMLADMSRSIASSIRLLASTLPTVATTSSSAVCEATEQRAVGVSLRTRRLATGCRVGGVGSSEDAEGGGVEGGGVAGGAVGARGGGAVARGVVALPAQSPALRPSRTRPRARPSP